MSDFDLWQFGLIKFLTKSSKNIQNTAIGNIETIYIYDFLIYMYLKISDRNTNKHISDNHDNIQREL
jgi:hypothetical protein